jgi:hypothetical protein
MTHDREAEKRAEYEEYVRGMAEDARMVREWEAMQRPAEPEGSALWYRGWETGYSHDAAMWAGAGYYAALGGLDLDCIQVTARTWAELLDEIDDHDMTEAGQ